MEAAMASPAPKSRPRGQTKQQATGLHHQIQASTPQRPPRRAQQQQTPSRTNLHVDGKHARQSRGVDTNKTESCMNAGIDTASPRPAQPQAATPIKQMAYAGPTFHASPAPSALPMPKFFSKSVPNAASSSTLQARLNASPSHTPASPSPQSGTTTPLRREESPLDLLFNAHRAEQAKHSLASPRPAASTSAQSDRSRGQASTGKQIFLMELDGAGDGFNPSLEQSVAFKERFGTPKQTPQAEKTPTSISSDEQERITKSMALKNLLNVQSDVHPSPPPLPPPPPLEHTGTMRQSTFVDAKRVRPDTGLPQAGQYASPSPQPSARFNVGDSRYMAESELVQARNQPDVKSMEADLRKLLKLS